MLERNHASTSNHYANYSNATWKNGPRSTNDNYGTKDCDVWMRVLPEKELRLKARGFTRMVRL